MHLWYDFRHLIRMSLLTRSSFVLMLLISLVFYILLCVLFSLVVLYSVPCCCTRYSLLSCTLFPVAVLGTHCCHVPAPPFCSLDWCTCLWIGVLVFGLVYLSLDWRICLWLVSLLLSVASLCFQSLTVIENLVYLLLKRRVSCWWKRVPGLGE